MARGGGGNGGARGGGNGPPKLNNNLASLMRYYSPLQDGAYLFQRKLLTLGNKNPVTTYANLASTDGGVAFQTTTSGINMLAAVFSGAGGPNGTWVGTDVDGGFGLNFSCGAWISPRSLAATGHIVGRNNGMRLATTGKVQGYFLVGGVLKQVESTTVLATSGPLHDVIFTYDGAFLRLYINGIQEASLAESGTPDPANFVQYGFGAQFDGSTRFNGHIAHPFIQGKTLNAGEVLKLHADGPDAFLDPPVFGDEEDPPIIPPVFPRPNSGTGYLVAGAGSLLRGVSATGSSLLNSLIPVGTTPQDGGYH